MKERLDRVALILAAIALAAALLVGAMVLLDPELAQGVTARGARHSFPGTILTDYGIFEQSADVRDTLYVDTVGEYTAASGVTVDSVLLKDGGVTASLTGDVTGDVTGDLTGNVTGNVTGDVTGTLTGNVTGNVTGDVTGDLTGNVTGDVTGNVTGDVTGTLTGNVTGNVTGDVTGDLTGNVTGDVTGTLTGNVTGNVTGDVTGDLTGDILGSSGTTIYDSVTITGTLDVAGASLNYGPNNLYPIGYTDSGFQAKWGSDVITSTANVTHGLTTPVVGLCTLAGELVDNEEQKCSLKITGSTVSIYVYKEDGSAGDSGVTVYWYLIGLP